MTVLTLAQADDLAERIHAAIDLFERDSDTEHYLDADRERVASDLDGLRECWGDVRDCTCDEFAHRLSCPSRLSPHAARYSEGLLRTARLYGVTVMTEPTRDLGLDQPDCDGRCADGRQVCTLWHGPR